MADRPSEHAPLLAQPAAAGPVAPRYNGTSLAQHPDGDNNVDHDEDDDERTAAMSSPGPSDASNNKQTSPSTPAFASTTVPVGANQNADENGALPPTPDGPDDSAAAAYLAKPWHHRIPLLTLFASGIFAFTFFFMCVPSLSQISMDWACDMELADMTDAQLRKLGMGSIPDDLRDLCTVKGSLLELAVQKRASSVRANTSFLESLFTLITCSLWGKICDRVGRVFVFRISVLCCILALTGPLSMRVLPLAWNPGLSYVSAVLSGLLGGLPGVSLALSSYVTDSSNADERITLFGLLQGMISVSGMISPLLGTGVLMLVGGNIVPLYALSISGMLAIVVFLQAVPEAPSAQNVRAPLYPREMFDIVANPFASLALFAPSPLPSAMYRFYIACVIVLVMVGETLFGNVWTLYSALHWNWSTPEWSALLTAKAASSAVLLLVGSPILARLIERAEAPSETVILERGGSCGGDVDVLSDSDNDDTTSRGSVDSTVGNPEEHDAEIRELLLLQEDQDQVTPLIPADMVADTSDDDLAEFDTKLNVGVFGTPALALTCLIDFIGLAIQTFARTGALFGFGSMFRVAASVVEPIQSSLLTRLVPASHIGALFAGTNLVGAITRVAVPVVANWIYNLSLERDRDSGWWLPGADVFAVSAVASLIGFVGSVVVSVLVVNYTRKQALTRQ
ncbi:hypothetical protein BC828DRAFT_384396 [Blastocladiella britannica]|nr:hypothetical protein BC828DRAFT_384396 [Blastocladiella britannica]